MDLEKHKESQLLTQLKYEIDSSKTQALLLEPTFWLTRHNPEGRKMNVYCRKPSNVMIMCFQNRRVTKLCYATVAACVKHLCSIKVTQ